MLCHQIRPCWKALNDRLMTMRLHLSGNEHATIISAYAPTATNPDKVKDNFYDDLDSILQHPVQLVLLGDFSARVGTDNQILEFSDRLRRCR